MRISAVYAVLVGLGASSSCFALMTMVRGNAPQAEANYRTWPGLIRVVNDPARAYLVWVNGDERLSYRGDTAALNRILKAFGDVEAAELRVILRPAPVGGARVPEEKEPADCQLHVVGGIVRQMAQLQKTESVVDWHPTLTIFVSKRVDLKTLVVPKKATILQLEDLRAAFLVALKVGSDESKAEAGRQLDLLNADTTPAEADAAEFRRQVEEIREFVSGWEAGK